jgi:hypothetical protein
LESPREFLITQIPDCAPQLTLTTWDKTQTSVLFEAPQVILMWNQDWEPLFKVQVLKTQTDSDLQPFPAYCSVVVFKPILTQKLFENSLEVCIHFPWNGGTKLCMKFQQIMCPFSESFPGYPVQNHNTTILPLHFLFSLQPLSLYINILNSLTGAEFLEV